MRQAITTKYLPATATMGARVKARAGAATHSESWDHGLDVPENHTKAARRLALKLRWDGDWAGGELPDQRGYAFVRADVDMTVVTSGGDE